MTATFRRELCCECETCGTVQVFDDIDIESGPVTFKKLKAVSIRFGWKYTARRCYCKECNDQYAEHIASIVRTVNADIAQTRSASE